VAALSFRGAAHSNDRRRTNQVTINKEHLHKKLHHLVFSVSAPSFSAINAHVKDEKIKNIAIGHLKTRGNAQRNRAVDEYEFYKTREELVVFLSGILKFASEMAYTEAYTAISGRVDKWEEIVAELKAELTERLEENKMILLEEIK
jgi:predicted amino acid racemase